MFIDNDVTEELNSINAIDQSINENTPKPKKKEQKKEIKPTIKDLLSNSEINIHQKITTPPSILSIDDISFGTLGNFSCLTGKSKSRKTFFLSILIAAALDNSGKFQRINSEILDTTVLHFDTEQSEYHTQLVAKRVVNLIDEKELSNYRCYCLRPHEPKTRINIIKEAIYNIKNVKLVVVDGIADLIIGYNNEDEAIKVIGEFMKWTFEKNIHIITIVHQNKGDNNAKGHLGSLILQKAETVLSIERDGAVSNVESTHSRGIEIQPMSFSIDDYGLPYFVDYTPKLNQNKSEKTNPFNIDIEVHKTILKDTFEGLVELNRADFLNKIKYVLGSYSHSNGDNKCKEFLNYYKERNLVTQSEKFKPYTLNI